MNTDHNQILDRLEEVVSRATDRRAAMRDVAEILRSGGGYRWVGLYDVDRAAGVVRNIVWNGSGAPEYPTFPIANGLTGAVIADRKTLNAGNVTSDTRYLATIGGTRSEIIVPVFDQARENVAGTIDVESELPNAFDKETESLLEACSEVIRPLWLY